MKFIFEYPMIMGKITMNKMKANGSILEILKTNFGIRQLDQAWTYDPNRQMYNILAQRNGKKCIRLPVPAVECFKNLSEKKGRGSKGIYTRAPG